MSNVDAPGRGTRTSRKRRVRRSEQSESAEIDARRRAKVTLACEACRLRKVKCDGALPICSTCRRRQAPERCLYDDGSVRASVTKAYVRGLHDRIRSLENINRSETHEPDAYTPGSGAARSHNQLYLSTESYFNNSPSNFTTLEDSLPERNQSHSSPGKQMSGYTDGIICESAGFEPSFQSLKSPQLNDIPSTADRSLGNLDRQNPISAMGAVSNITESGVDCSDHFYGTSSVVSFSQQITQTHRHPSVSSHSITTPASVLSASGLVQNTFLDDSSNMASSNLDDYFLPPRVLADHLLDCYWDRVHCLYPFLNREVFTIAYNNLWLAKADVGHPIPQPRVGLGGSGCSRSMLYCAINGIFAIGCQFANLPSAKRVSLSETFFQRSKQLLRIDILDSLFEGNLALIQTLLISAQYLQSTQFPNKCWNVVGLACRMSQGLGLYLENDNEQRPFIERQMRRQTWYGCVILDLVLSMTLGRPTTLSGDWTVHLPEAIDDEYMDNTSLVCKQPPDIFPRMSFYVCTIKLYKILGDILVRVYNLWKPAGGSKVPFDWLESCPLDTFVKLEKSLSDFENDIPEQIYWSSVATTDAASVYKMQTNVLQARYLHLKILLYRPIFTQLCRKASPNAQTRSGRHFNTDALPEYTGDNGLYSSLSQQCSIACVESSQALIDLISRTCQTKLTGAWWYNVFYVFTSAMVIILAERCPLLVSKVGSGALEASWMQSQNTLELLGTHNVGAKKCGETLRAMRQQVSQPSYGTESQSPIIGSPNPPGNRSSQRQPSPPNQSFPGNDFRSQTYAQRNQNDDAQLREMLWQDVCLVPQWNIDDGWWWNTDEEVNYFGTT